MPTCFQPEACAKVTIERDVLVCGCYSGDCLHRIPEINKYSRPSLSLSLLASPFGDFRVGGARDESHTRRPDCPFPSSRLVNTDRIGGFCRVYAMPCMPCQRRPGKKIRLSEFELPTTRHLSHDSGLVEKNTPDACRNGQAGFLFANGPGDPWAGEGDGIPSGSIHARAALRTCYLARGHTDPFTRRRPQMKL